MPHRRPLLAAAVLLLTLGVLYLPDAGHGFLRDDFAWIRASRLSGLGDLPRLFATDNGFYRPLVNLSFALNHAVFGLSPLGYGLTNLLLMLAAAAALFGLTRASGLPPGTPLVATALWALNPHSIPMAVLWISGRTSLLLTVFCLLAARSVVKDQRPAAALWCLAALLSKEEAVLLPAILFLWAGLAVEKGLGFRWRQALVRTWPLLLTVVPYALLRARTAAYLPQTAPAYYRPTLSPSLLLANALEYADRSLTLGLVLLLLLWLVSRKRPHLEAAERLGIARGLILALGSFGVTLFLPVRSSLYVCLPATGTALAIAAVAGALWRNVGQAGQRRLLAGGLFLPLLLVPTYRARARRWVTPADVSHAVFMELAQSPAPAGAVTVIHDATGRASVAGAFGTHVQDALALATGASRPRVWLDPPPPLWESTGLRPPRPGEKVHEFTLRDGHLVPGVAATPSGRAPTVL